MKKIKTSLAPQAIGPYSQAITYNGLIYTSGQIPLTADGQMVEEDIEKQTHQVIKNVQAVLQAAESDLDQVIKVTLYIKDMDQFERINAVYLQYFNQVQPARSCVEVSRLPKDVRIEMEAIAIKKEK
ncbi:RidA family protein [Hazenella sp. IB182357]|uniref:RidA family protein n=1 Tax=Polycladospora coralii TaxID=2771432 RepID=A0A926NFP5_9BACL|nr:RidA family protein [Polycladospora coralii]MBD1372468.1 RidA family protein [Polycladospora coralii]MBS7531790.1 RidA family protein [Polycladospora coralii]